MRRSSSASYAAQLIQERMEQFRRIPWTEITSDYPPDEEDDTSVDYVTDEDGEPYVDDTYPTEFPYDLSDLDALVPGMVDVMATPTNSGAQLRDVVEKVTIESYNPKNTAMVDAYEWNGSLITIAPVNRQVDRTRPLPKSLVDASAWSSHRRNGHRG